MGTTATVFLCTTVPDRICAAARFAETLHKTAHGDNNGCEETDTREIADSKTPHSYGEYVVTKQPTYDAEGEEKSTCTVCGDSITRAVPVKEKPADGGTDLLWLYILIAVIAAALLCLLIILLARKIKRKNK